MLYILARLFDGLKSPVQTLQPDLEQRALVQGHSAEAAAVFTAQLVVDRPHCGRQVVAHPHVRLASVQRAHVHPLGRLVCVVCVVPRETGWPQRRRWRRRPSGHRRLGHRRRRRRTDDRNGRRNSDGQEQSGRKRPDRSQSSISIHRWAGFGWQQIIILSR